MVLALGVRWRGLPAAGVDGGVAVGEVPRSFIGHEAVGLQLDEAGPVGEFADQGVVDSGCGWGLWVLAAGSRTSALPRWRWRESKRSPL